MLVCFDIMNVQFLHIPAKKLPNSAKFLSKYFLDKQLNNISAEEEVTY